MRKKIGAKRVFSIRLEPYVIETINSVLQKMNKKPTVMIRWLLREFAKIIKTYYESKPEDTKIEDFIKTYYNSSLKNVIHFNNKNKHIVYGDSVIHFNKKVFSLYLNEAIFKEIQDFAGSQGYLLAIL